MEVTKERGQEDKRSYQGRHRGASFMGTFLGLHGVVMGDLGGKRGKVRTLML